MLIPGIGMLSSQWCEENPKDAYDEHKVTVAIPKGKGKHQKLVKETFTIKTRKSNLITHNISICVEAYNYMLDNSPDPRLMKKWRYLSKDTKLKIHFDLIAHDLKAVSYSYQILDD